MLRWSNRTENTAGDKAVPHAAHRAGWIWTPALKLASSLQTHRAERETLDLSSSVHSGHQPGQQNLLTSPFFSLAVPSQSLISWPSCPQRAHGRGLLGLNSSLMMVKFGSWVAKPSMIRSAERKALISQTANDHCYITKGFYDRFFISGAEISPSAPHRQWCVLGSWLGWAVRMKTNQSASAAFRQK